MGSNKNKTLPKMQRFAIVAVFAALVAEAEAHRRRWRHGHKPVFSGDKAACIIGGEKGELSGKISFSQPDTEGADTKASARFFNLQTEETVDEVTTPAGVYTIDIRSDVTVADTDAGATNDECGAGTVTETLVSDFTVGEKRRAQKWGMGYWENEESGLTLADSSVTGNWAVITLNGDTPAVVGCCQITAKDDGSSRRLADILQ